MKIITRYIAIEIALYFLLSLSIFTGLLITLRMIKLTSLVINKGVEFHQILTIFLSLLPTFLEVALPMSTLLGVMLAFGRLSGDSELIVIRASGISLNKLIKPVLIFGVLTTLMTLIVSVYLRPLGYHYLSETLFEIATQKSTAGLTEGVFNRIGKITLYSEKIDYKTGALQRVIVDDQRNPNTRQIAVAKHGKIISSPKERRLTFLLSDGEIHARVGDKYNMTQFAQNEISVDPNENLDTENTERDKKTREMLLPELRQNLESQRELMSTLLASNLERIPAPNDTSYRTEEEGFITKRDIKDRISSLYMEIIRKYSIPFACIVFSLLAMPLGIQPPRSRKTWGASLSIMIGLGVIIIYYGTLTLGTAYGKKGIIDPYLALWGPNILLLGLAIIALRKMSSEEWQSVTDFFEWIIEHIPFVRRLSPRTK